MKKFLQTFLLLSALMAPWATKAQSTLTICNGTATSGYVPVYGFYCDAFLKAHFVYPSDSLTTMGGGTLMGMTFYATQESVSWGDAHFNVYLSEVPGSTVSDFATVTGLTQVYSGSLSISNNTMVVTFDSPYSYNGGNLFVAVEVDTTGSYVTSTWTGVAATGSSVQGYSYSALTSISATQRDFLPKVTFDYLPAGATPCMAVKNLTAGNVTSHEVTLTWSDTINTGATYSVYNMTDTSIVATGITGTTYTVTGLTPETAYIFGVEVNCSATDASRMVTVRATTDVSCPAPTGLEVDNISGFTADVMWNGTSNSYNLEYAAYTPSATAAWLQYDNDTVDEVVGSSSAQTWTWGVMYPASMLTGNFLTKVAFYEASNNYYTDNTVTVNIYSGGDDAPGTLIGTVTVATEGTNGMREVYINPIQINQTQNLWITLTTTATYCMGLSDNDGGGNGRWILFDDEWGDLGDSYSNAEESSFMIRGYVDNADLMWINMTNVTSPYQLDDLTPVTGYYVRVKGNCGADGMSAWTATHFTTDVACPVPTRLTAPEVYGNGATLGWSGFDSVYNVRYRVAATYEGINDDFENGLSRWTIYTAGDTVDGHSDGWYTYNPANGDLDFPSHGGDYCASAWSWHSSALDADNWLVTPQVPLGDSLTFWVRTNSSWPDSYEVLLSTTNNDTASFTVTLQALAPAPNNGQWNQVTIDLSSYSGYGYIALHHVDHDANYLLIDDFNCSREAAPAGEWVYVTSNTNSIDLTDLDPNTTYEFQVQGICSGETTDWSESCQFTTTNSDMRYTVTVYVVNTDRELNVGGTVTGEGRYAAGTEVTLTATPDEGYVFQGWYTFSVTEMTADLLEANATYTVTVDSNIVIAALFGRTDGIDDIDASSVTVFARENGVVVRGAAQQQVYVYDVVGRLAGHVDAATDEVFIRLPQKGVYLVKVGELPARSILVRK